MIAKKIISLSLSTGEVISGEITGSVEMTKDEYWDPLVAILARRSSEQGDKHD